MKHIRRARGELVRVWFLRRRHNESASSIRAGDSVSRRTRQNFLIQVDRHEKSSPIGDGCGVLAARRAGWSDADSERSANVCRRAFLAWMQTVHREKRKLRARKTTGTWYERQIAALALFTGDTASREGEIGRVCTRSGLRRRSRRMGVSEELARSGRCSTHSSTRSRFIGSPR
jgi:hypothetical protein